MFNLKFGRRAADKPKPVEVIVPIFNEDMALGTISGRKIHDLADEELKTLWFVLDKYMDTDTLGEIYCEMKKRNLHVLLPSELTAREGEITRAIHGIKPPTEFAWQPGNAAYEDRLS